MTCDPQDLLDCAMRLSENYNAKNIQTSAPSSCPSFIFHLGDKTFDNLTKYNYLKQLF